MLGAAVGTPNDAAEPSWVIVQSIVPRCSPSNASTYSSETGFAPMSRTVDSAAWEPIRICRPAQASAVFWSFCGLQTKKNSPLLTCGVRGLSPAPANSCRTASFSHASWLSIALVAISPTSGEVGASCENDMSSLKAGNSDGR